MNAFTELMKLALRILSCPIMQLLFFSTIIVGEAGYPRCLGWVVFDAACGADSSYWALTWGLIGIMAILFTYIAPFFPEYHQHKVQFTGLALMMLALLISAFCLFPGVPKIIWRTHCLTEASPFVFFLVSVATTINFIQKNSNRIAIKHTNA